MGSEVAKVKISIPPNPSHLEAVNAVVQVGFCFAASSLMTSPDADSGSCHQLALAGTL